MLLQVVGGIVVPSLALYTLECWHRRQYAEQCRIDIRKITQEYHQLMLKCPPKKLVWVEQ